MLKLKEATYTVGVDVVGNRRAPKLDRVFQNLAEREPKPLEFCPGESARAAPRTDAGVKQALVGVNIPYPGEQGLVEQRRLNGESPTTKKGGKPRRINGERLSTLGCERWTPTQVAKFEPAEPARVDETQFLPACQCEPCVGMSSNGSFGSGNKQSARHAQVHNPLSVGRCRVQLSVLCRRSRWAGNRGHQSEFADDVFPGAMYGKDCSAFEGFGLPGRRSLEGLLVLAKPRGNDSVAVHTLVNAVGDCLHFGELRHLLIVGGASELEKAPCLGSCAKA